jgi:molecular chaperone DnaJ
MNIDMNIDEAYSVLSATKDTPDEELKKLYRKLAVENHPDKGGSSDKMKQINEAYQLIQDYRENPHKYQSNPFSNFHNYASTGGFQDFNPFVSFENIFFQTDINQDPQRQFNFPQINVKLSISFKESILGTEKEIKYKKFIKCEACNGRGQETKGNGCKSCDGFGRITSTNKGMTYTRACQVCWGKDLKKHSCKKCSNKGVIENNIAITIQIPSGVQNGNSLRLRGAGSYAGSMMFNRDAYSDAFISISVEKDPDLSLEGNNVISTLNLSLLDALTGKSLEVKTIHGNKSIAIPKLSKNKDEIHIKNCGVKSQNGVQRVILNVEYPDDIKDLINFLTEKS